MKISKRIFGYLGVLAFLLFTYVWCCNSYLLIAAIVLAGALLLSAICSAIGKRGLQIDMTAKTPEGQQEGEIEILIHHEGALHLGNLCVEMELKNIFMNTKNDTRFSFPLRIFTKESKGAMEFVAKYSGLYEAKMANCYLEDLFGIVRFFINAEQKADTLMMPEGKIEITDTSLNSASQLGELVLNEKGDDRNEIYNLRDFQPGDLYKNVHWKLYAKAGEKYVKEGSLNVEEQVCVLYNVSPSASLELKNQVAEVLAAVAKYLVSAHIIYDGVYLAEGKAMTHHVGTVENSIGYLEYVLMNPLNQTNHELLENYLSEWGGKDIRHNVYVTDNVDGLEPERNRLVVLVTEQDYQIMEV